MRKVVTLIPVIPSHETKIGDDVMVHKTMMHKTVMQSYGVFVADVGEPIMVMFSKSGFTEKAREVAKKLGVLLVDGGEPGVL
ncbi:hypothetical protein A3L09_09575 [Thermococcus profundus]|uniref:Uncharacterized protein n=1 Tax=Thermococcus profundus TaxID=49899 RepID=A0A2Z2MFH8_THEPR|nr:hypothetical protein [Thermococcus profundus]ASJ03492.1 hypothetical protein A3L09_09575 [Thermococcus profundus]